ncbi:hypothetical protein [Anaeromyxobacter terrae]|uniref:hypothetical protein n=1 Tax=Anaeromyxobacter terrae TaxID=2925406 RepID=UPI001F5795BD|nr:hypothetical protein [Anaeromyxobacter sp. SG22]
MKRLSLAAITLAVLSLSPATGAQTSLPYMTVDAVNVGTETLQVTGIVQGESSPSTKTVRWTLGNPSDTLKAARLEACHRSLLLALSKPGQYVAQVGSDCCNVALVAP